MQTEKFQASKINGLSWSPELGHSCRALAINVLDMFFSPARNSSLTDSNLINTEHF